MIAMAVSTVANRAITLLATVVRVVAAIIGAVILIDDAVAALIYVVVGSFLSTLVLRMAPAARAKV